MKNLIKFLSIIGLVSMSHAAIAIDNVSDGDVLTADTMNEIIDATNNNSQGGGGLDFDINCSGGPVYSVGDTGVDGLIFFVTADGCNGLEAASVDQSSGTHWGCDGTDVPGASGFDIGEGGPNTQDILSAGCTNGTTDAVDAARAYAGGGENDWYLASPDELIEMCITIGPGGSNAVGLNADAYWSSVDSNETHAIGVQMSTCNIVNEHTTPPGTPKGFNYHVRAIRTLD